MFTLATLVLAAGFSVARVRGWRFGGAEPASPPGPENAVYSMLASARGGNVAAYLASFSGPLEASLRESVRESGEAEFAKYLKDSNAALKGVAVGAAQKLDETGVNVRVEYVYQDRNEVQTMRLENMSDGWKITRIDGAERAKTLVPYGTPVR